MARIRHWKALTAVFVLVGAWEFGLRYTKVAASMKGIKVEPGRVSFPARVNKATGWVQVGVCPRSIYWLAPDAMLVTACSLTGIQRAFRLAGIPPDGIVFQKGRRGPFEFKVSVDGKETYTAQLFELPKEDVVRVRDLIFVGASKLTRLMFKEMELGLCATCPIQGRDLAMIYADFIRPSGEAGFVLREPSPLRKGKEVVVTVRRRAVTGEGALPSSGR